MTEKRFTYLDASRNKYIGSFFCNGVPLTNDEVVDLLNENEELNQKNELLTLQLDCHKHPLLKENRELVSDLNHELEVSNSLRDVVKSLETENKQLKQENQRMTNKLNELAFEFLKHNMISVGKATEISEMCYHDFLKYRKEKWNPMELQL